MKQWKESLSEPIWLAFIQCFADRLTLQIVETVLTMKLSLLGALFFENAVTKLKKFFQKEASEVRNHVQELTEVAQLLACESIEEVQSFLET